MWKWMVSGAILGPLLLFIVKWLIDNLPNSDMNSLGFGILAPILIAPAAYAVVGLPGSMTGLVGFFILSAAQWAVMGAFGHYARHQIIKHQLQRKAAITSMVTALLVICWIRFVSYSPGYGFISWRWQHYVAVLLFIMNAVVVVLAVFVVIICLGRPLPLPTQNIQ